MLELTEYQAHLQKTQPDWESRWDNVEELLNFATEVERSLAPAEGRSSRDLNGKGKERAVQIELDSDGEEVDRDQE